MKTTTYLLAGALFVALGTPPPARAEDAPFIELDPAAFENLDLEFAEVQSQELDSGIRAPGVVKLNEKRVVDVAARISGIIEQDFQALGAQVSIGDRLFDLESAQLAEAITSYIDAEQAMAFANTALAQEKKLVEKNLSSTEQLQQRELAFRQAVAGHERALQPLKLLHFNEGSIHQHLHNVGAGNYTTLETKSPVAGEVIDKSVRLGAAVEPDQTLYTIADLSEVWVDFRVSLRDAGNLAEKAPVQVRSSISNQQRDAEIIYIAPLADETTRTVMARALMKNDDRAWRPGNPVVVTATSGKGETGIAVPASAVVELDGQPTVFLRTGDHRFAPTPIETGATVSSLIEIVSGLKPGDTVVSKNAAQLKGHLEMTAEN